MATQQEKYQLGDLLPAIELVWFFCMEGCGGPGVMLWTSTEEYIVSGRTGDWHCWWYPGALPGCILGLRNRVDVGVWSQEYPDLAHLAGLLIRDVLFEVFNSPDYRHVRGVSASVSVGEHTLYEHVCHAWGG